MTEQLFHFVRLEQAPDWLKLGWIGRPILNGTHHGEWSVAMEWLCDCPAPRPNKTKLKLARHREVPTLQLLGWEVCGDWSPTFVLMQIKIEPRETNSVDLRPLISSQAA